jgi:uncharacterized protein DUF6922
MKSKRKRKKPKFKFRPSLFWDADPNSIDPRRHARYIIERILDFGDEREVRWMAQTYSRRRIKSTIARSRVLHEKSRSLWKLVFA